MFATRESHQTCGRCGHSAPAGEGRIEPSEGHWLCRRCVERLAAPVVQRASTCALLPLADPSPLAVSNTPTWAGPQGHGKETRCAPPSAQP